MASARPGLFPWLPVLQPPSPAHPFGPFDDLGISVADTEVVEPSGDVAAPFVGDVLHPMSPVAAGDFSHPPFEACMGLGGPHPFSTGADPESQKGTGFKWRGLALGPVDYPCEPSFHESRQACHNPFGRLGALAPDQEVVGLPGQTKPAPFTLLVQRVQRDVGQPRRLRPAWRRPSFQPASPCRPA